jgi:hypothetical protein
VRSETGGAGRDRTGDLLNANQALSQLSYSPFGKNNRGRLDATARDKREPSEVKQTFQVENPERNGLERLPPTDTLLLTRSAIPRRVQ